MTPMEKLNAVVEHLISVFFSPSSTFSIYALSMAFLVAVAFLAFRRQRRRGHVNWAVIRRAIFSKRLIVTRSTRADVGYFFFNTTIAGGLIGWGVLSGAEVAKVVQAGLTGVFGALAPSTASEFVQRAGVTLFLFLAYEFGYWLDHYLKHRVRFLWEMHKTHHSAEVLTPWTVWRVHPLDTLVFMNVLAFVMGAAGGIANWALGRETAIFAVDGVNALLVFFLYATIQLQHSQFWIPITGGWGRVFMSPAHHQIHHSNDPAHYNRNMGSCLALWDWMFGTLEIPTQEFPHLVYGVESDGEDPHAVATLVLTPFRRSFAELVAALTPKHPAPGGVVTADK